MWTKQLKSITGFTTTPKNSKKEKDADNNARALAESLAEQERLNRLLQQREELFRNAFDFAGIGTVLVAPNGDLLKGNHAFFNTFGYHEEDLQDKNFRNLTHEEDLDSFNERIVQLLNRIVETSQLEQRVKHKQGHYLWTKWAVSRCKDGNDSTYFIFQLQTVSHRKRPEQRLTMSAMHDPLTGLPNRVNFMERLQIAFKRTALQPNNKFAVLFLDFDRFDLVNNNIEQAVGEQLPIEISRRLESSLRASDTVARLSGDEFAVLLENVADQQEVIQVTERLIEDFAHPFNINDYEFSTNLCIGVAVWSPEAEVPNSLLRDANTAFLQAKRLGRNRYEIFDVETHKRISYTQQLDHDLRFALERNEFCLHYQPIIDLNTLKLIGLEALIRWRHPKLGLISPMEFISIAEENGMISAVGLWVLRESCHQFYKWQQRYPPCAEIWLSVNVSSKQLTNNALSGEIKRILKETEILPESLKLEITESAVINNFDAAVKTLNDIRDLGVQISVDDFGTGYSSLNNLHRLPVDSLKIDRSFIIKNNGSDENWEIVKSILTLAETLNLEVVAEGVETGEQVVRLRTLGCQLGQGYYFAQPLDPAAVDNLFIELKNANQNKSVDEMMLEYFTGIKQ
jgi:diguanylate cyclase (GGDEF)-like protein/PAS domain S-box-containing protein